MRITEELIRRKSEHNEDTLENLEEIALHQLEIEKIELIDRLCKDLKILLLQNNLIERLENLGRLKRLEYLNVALNNIEVIENLERCESLKKLDLTVNFISLAKLEESLQNLKGIDSLEDLYLMGNPCTEWVGCRSFTVATLLQLKQLDGKTVTPVERIEALRSLPALREDLRKTILLQDKLPTENSKDAYTRENRKRMYREMSHREEAQAKANAETEKKAKPFETYNSKGEIRQCNEGRLAFTLDSFSDPGQIVATFQLPRHLSTLLIDVDVHPKYLRVTVKGKITQLRLPEDVSPDRSTVKRSQTTGELRICMPTSSTGRIAERPRQSNKQLVSSTKKAQGKALSCQTDDSPVQSHTTNRDLGLQDKNEVSLETDPPPLEEIYPLNSAGQPR